MEQNKNLRNKLRHKHTHRANIQQESQEYTMEKG